MPQTPESPLAYALSTQVIEQLFPSQEAMRLCEQMSCGAISVQEAVTSLLAAHGLGREAAHD